MIRWRMAVAFAWYWMPDALCAAILLFFIAEAVRTL